MLQPTTYDSEATKPKCQVDSSTINKRLDVCGITFALSRSSLHVRFESLQCAHDVSATILLTLTASFLMMFLVLALDLLLLLDYFHSSFYILGGHIGTFCEKVLLLHPIALLCVTCLEH